MLQLHHNHGGALPFPLCKDFRQMHTSKSALRRLFGHEQFAMFLCLLGLCLVASLLSPYFFGVKNIMNVLRSASLIAITGAGMVLIILLGDIDLSVGSTQGLVGVWCALAIDYTGSLALTIVFALAVGALIGLANAALVTRGGITPLIATLGTMAILRGAAFVTTNGASVQVKHSGFTWIGTGYVGPFPVPLLIAFAICLVLSFVLSRTAFGRYIYAAGGCGEAAKLSGIDVDSIKRRAYVVSGALTALSALLLAARMSTGQPNAGVGFEFQVIAAVVLGGVSLTGGKGTLLGAVVGILILSVLSNIMVLMNVNSFYQEIARGAVILLAVYIDCRNRKVAEQRLRRAKVV